MRKTKHKGGGGLGALRKLCEKFEAAKRDPASYDPARRKKKRKKRRDPDPKRRRGSHRRKSAGGKRRARRDPKIRRPKIRGAAGPWYLSDPAFKEAKTATRTKRYAPKHSAAAKKGWKRRSKGKRRGKRDAARGGGMSYRRALALASG